MGFRRTLVVQEKLIDQPGLSFFFEVNDIPVFAGGSNWIPADNFVRTEHPDGWIGLNFP